MLSTRNTIFFGVFFLLLQIALPSFSQPGYSITVKKPKPYEERVLRAEKTDQTKFNAPRHFFQNTFTHYNYYFNANNKLNEMLERVKLGHRDDYSQLLTFYSYTLDETSQFIVELDSLVYKAKTAIVLHDLRNDWVDNMYLIWGAAYYYRKDFDSAFRTFQFINYAFAPKEKDGYYRYIGSKMDNNLANIISTKEKNTLTKRVFSLPPSRNDAFIWQAKTFIAMERYAEASTLIAALKNDPTFPERLQNDLQEVQALYYYHQNMWDSSALHLIEALSNAPGKKERARWEYLIGQMFEKSHRYADAQTYYTKTISHTIDPVLEIYARLSSIRVNKTGGEDYIQKNVAELVKMARKDRYEDYRDIIYYMAAQMEMERSDTASAEKFLLKSVAYRNGNDAQRNKAFLQLAEFAFAKKKYRQSANYYDSLQMGDPDIPNPEKINERKEVLKKIAFNLETIERQDSLQNLATLPEDARKDYVKKLARKIRKQQGLKEEDNFKGQPQGLSSTPQNAQQSTDIFGVNQQKGEWYFYNQTARTKGSGDFKSKWGNRPNVDNWRRSVAVQGALRGPNANSNAGNNNAGANGNPQGQSNEITFDALYDRIPLTPEKLKLSDDSIKSAMIALSKLYAEELEDCGSCIDNSEKLLQRYPDASPLDEVLFYMYRCYSKNGDIAKADQVKKQLIEKYPDANNTTIVKTGKNPLVKHEEPQATKTYEGIYDLLVAGDFDEALNQKKIADSIYGSHYWTPQLLYVEAVYLAKHRQDTSAEHVLEQIIALYPGNPLTKKAETLYNVLKRRTIIENELANLVLPKPEEDTVTALPPPVAEEKRTAKRDTSVIAQKQPDQPKIENKNVIKKSTTDSLTVKVPPPLLSSFDFDPSDKHFVVILLTKVDNVFRNETKNAFGIYNKEKYYNKTFDYSTLDINADNKLLLIGGFDNAQAAIDYLQEAKPVATTRIIPWLKPEKYSFSIISSRNLDLLKSKLNLEDYRKFVDKYWQGKF